MGKKLTVEDIKKYVQKKFNGQVKLLNTHIRNGRRYVWIKCIYCGHEWERSYNHLRRNSRKLCPNCHFGEDEHSYHRGTLDELRNKCKDRGIEYSIPDQEYINSFTKIRVSCLEHGEFLISPCNLLAGKGCAKCRDIRQSERQRKNIDSVVNSITIVGKGEYEWFWGEYHNQKSKLYFRHKCGTIFAMSYLQFTHKDSRERIKCPVCRNTNSNGERIIYILLSKNQYNFERQYPIVVDGRRLYVDFIVRLKDISYAIEYDGEQHYVPVKHFGGKSAYESLCLRDNLKDNWCRQNDYKLIRIPYTKSSSQEIYHELKKYFPNLKYDEAWNFMSIDKCEIAKYAVTHKSNKATQERYGLSETTVTKIVKEIYGDDVNLCTYTRDHVNSTEVVNFYLVHSIDETCQRFGIKRHLVYEFTKKELGCNKRHYLKKN